MVPFLLYKLVLVLILTMILGFAPAMSDEIKKHFEHVNQDNVLPCVIVTSLFLIGMVLIMYLSSLRKFNIYQLNACYIFFYHIQFTYFTAVEAYFLLILFSHYQNVRHEAMETANAPPTIFTSAVPEPAENLAPYAPYNTEVPKKQAPPPYAV